MLVYVLNKHGKPLMPCSPRKARLLLKSHKAKVVNNIPFTIKLLYGSSGYVQDVALGIDSGSKTVGVSAVSGNRELYSGECKLRDDIVKLLSTRCQARHTRRSRKTRYRKPRFSNRVRSKHKGWLAPSVENKINAHLKIVKDIHSILPVSRIVIETASFDIQKIENPEISGASYQQGDQLGFWNVREYVLFRDGHTCQCCHGRSRDKILNIHHIESRKTGGNAPNNLITLCETCHDGYHKGKIKLPDKIKRGARFNDAAFMGIMRWECYNRLKTIYPYVSMTYGYITKNTRISHKLPKAHRIDARCIAGQPEAVGLGGYYISKCVRRHNRKIYKDKILKGGRRKRNQCPYEVKGFRRFDIVYHDGNIYYINSLRTNGYFVIKDLAVDGKGIEINPGKISLVNLRKGNVIKFIKDIA